jgi:hypothetical protein
MGTGKRIAQKQEEEQDFKYNGWIFGLLDCLDQYCTEMKIELDIVHFVEYFLRESQLAKEQE